MQTEVETKKIKLDNLKIAFDVRKHRLNEQRVQLLMQLVRTGVALPPIVIYWKNNLPFVLDGRHRAEAYARLNIEEVDVEERTFETNREIMLASFRANVNQGPLGPEPEDYKFFIRELKSDGMDNDLIVIELVGMGLPKTFCEAAISEALRTERREKIEAAAARVRDSGGTVSPAEAAAEFGVSPKEVLKQISKQVYDISAFEDDAHKAFQPIKNVMEKKLQLLLRNNPQAKREAISILQRGMDELTRYVESSTLPGTPA